MPLPRVHFSFAISFSYFSFSYHSPPPSHSCWSWCCEASNRMNEEIVTVRDLINKQKEREKKGSEKKESVAKAIRKGRENDMGRRKRACGGGKIRGHKENDVSLFALLFLSPSAALFCLRPSLTSLYLSSFIIACSLFLHLGKSPLTRISRAARGAGCELA